MKNELGIFFLNLLFFSNYSAKCIIVILIFHGSSFNFNFNFFYKVYYDV